MKKSLFTKWTIAMVAVFSLASCGEETIVDTPNIKKGKTVFSAGKNDLNIEGTRTMLDRDRTYFWQANDQIWVNDNGTWVKSSESDLSPDQKSANFYYDRLLTEPEYQVLYTGYKSNSATQVTIPASMSISQQGNIGVRGDCGVATATRQPDGTYKFALLHKASYLGVAPLKMTYLNKSYVCTKTEIVAANAKRIAGTFQFTAEGIDTIHMTSPSSKIELISQPDLAPALQSYNANINYTYVVLPPVYAQLTVKYYFIDLANPTDTLSVSKVLNPRKFLENNVVLFRHGLNPDFYGWDAPITEPIDVTRNTNWNAAAPYTQASRGCATMPNPNELYWYIVNGDPRWDNETEWTNDGGATRQTGGVWIKKKSVILSEGKTFDPSIGYNNVDMRTTFAAFGVASTEYKSNGKPANTNNYFFLPAQGLKSGDDITSNGTVGYYWSSYSSPRSTVDNEAMAYCLVFDSNRISINSAKRRYGCVAGRGSDWFK